MGGFHLVDIFTLVNLVFIALSIIGIVAFVRWMQSISQSLYIIANHFADIDNERDKQ